jgi:hypothetical protein
MPGLNAPHRWSIHRLLRWLLPLVMMIGVLGALLVERKAAGGSSFIEDRAYADMAVARTLVLDGTYGLQPGAPCPAVRDTLWRLALAIAGWLVGSVRVAALLLGTLCAVGTLLLTLRLARLLFPFPPFILYAAVLLTAAPGLLTNALSGTSLPLATLLVTAACLLQVEGMRDRRPVLSLGSTALVGLLTWIRLEFVWVWIVFWAQAVIRLTPEGPGKGRRAAAAVKGAAGVLLIGLMLLPLFAWNLHLLSVLWPQAAGAPMTLNAWAARPPGDVLAQGAALRSGCCRRSLAPPRECRCCRARWAGCSSGSARGLSWCWPSGAARNVLICSSPCCSSCCRRAWPFSILIWVPIPRRWSWDRWGRCS